MDETMAIGDSWNDAPLLRGRGLRRRDGLGAAGAARDRRRRASRDLAHDGVAEAIESYVLGAA